MKASGTSLWEACCTSLEEAKHVFARRDWGRKDLIEGVVRAAAEGKLGILEWLCAEGEELGMSDLVNSQSEVLGVSPLYVAARRGRLPVIEWLVDHGARLNKKNEAGRTALHAAAEGGHEDVVALLLTCGEDVNCSDMSGWTALRYARVAGHIDVVQQLIAHDGGGTDVETKTATVTGTSEHFVAGRNLGKGGSRLEIANYSEYLIDPEDIQLESSLRDGVEGVWLGSPVEVKMVKREDVLDTLDRWSMMSHSHVVRLYGACHVDGDGEPFFVYERAPFGSLVDYLDATRNEITSESLWTKLHEAALGLQYLHDRNIVHGNLNCDSIVVTANGVAKLRNIRRDITGKDDYLPWSAPELLLGSPPSFEADIYAFGMTIAQSFHCPRSMWRSQVLGLRDAIISGNLPDKPATMTAIQWELVKQMCCYKPKNRVSASIVVRELGMLIHGRRSKDSASESSTERWSHPSTACVADYNATVSSTLAAIVNMCSGSTATDRMYRDLYERLMDVFKQFSAPCNAPTIETMQRYSRILHYFHKKLKTADTASSAKTTSFVASRQVADEIFTVHGEVDYFMDRVELSREANAHKWRGLWELRRQQRQQEVAETLASLPEFLNGFESEHEREEALAYVQFEHDLHSKVSTEKDQRIGNIGTTEQLTGAHLAISYLRSTKIDSWFVPEYDIEFDSYDAYSEDINGSKHRGTWRRAQVLVRKLKLTAKTRRKDQEVFKANVKIWHKLRHPHIVQVFGACHVNPPFFVCEYVAGEQLSDYLRMHPEEVWNKLYEAALGLQYLHDKQVVHGDLRCSNILVGCDGSAKLSDFGFSMLDPEVSASCKPELKSGDKPKLGWRAPEVLQGEKATFASDIYSFGMCILEAVSGQYPADSGDDVYELAKQMCQYSPSDRISVFNVVDWFVKRSGSCCGPQLYFGESLDELDKIPGDGDDEAKCEAAESGCSALLCDLTAYMSRSTASSASDFGIPEAIITSYTPSTNKTWFIDQKDITFSSSKAFGRGGFAKVYHGTWRHAPVVLRRVRIQNEKDLATFLNEVKIWHKLRHPHIVQLFGACHISQHSLSASMQQADN